MALNKSLYKGKRELTMEQFQNLDVIDENTDYDIMDYPDNGMTNAQLVKTLDYNRLFKVGHITICLDDGVFRKGHILQLQVVDNVRIWKDITATSALDIDDLTKLGGLPLGAIIPIAMVTNDPYVQPLDGRNLSQTGIYADFCTWLKNRLNEDANNVPTCTIDEYATEIATYGQCGKFVINNSEYDLTSEGYVVRANSIKLPTITEFIASNNGGNAIGLAELDEFKSHSHHINDYSDSGANTNPEAIRINTNINTKTGYYEVYTGLTGGEETRPKNVRYPYYIVVATATKTDVQVDLDNVANDINNINTVLSRTEQIETIYDMNSNNPDINWGHTSGIYNNTTINGKDFTKYKKLRLITGVFWSGRINRTSIVEISLEPNATNVFAGGSVVCSYFEGTFYNYLIEVRLNTEKTSITFDAFRVTSNTDVSSGFVVLNKIEGVY